MADTISIDMANVLSYLRKRRADAQVRAHAVKRTGVDPTGEYGKIAAYDDALDKITQVLTSHAKSWVKFAHHLEQQVEHERT